MTFATLNTDQTPGTKNAGVQVLTAAEVAAVFAARGGGAGGAPGGAAPGGAAPPAAGGAAPGGGVPAGGRGGFDPATIFASWDANADGEVTEAEFDARPRRGGAPPGGAPGGAPPAPAQ
jgi:hypothetical protein